MADRVEEGINEKEGRNLLGPPTFAQLENGRFKCIETNHEVPAHARDSYADSKHCRLGLIDAALANNKPPLNLFRQDPLSRSKLICKLTGVTINKAEEHIWKHINGKKFLNKLEQKEAEKLAPSKKVKEQNEPKQKKVSKLKADVEKKKNKNKRQQEENIGKMVTEVRDPDMDSGSEEDDFWMPPMGDRWDCDNGGDRWGSGSELDSETEYTEGADAVNEEGDNDAGELSKRTKRMSIEIGPSNHASRKKKKKIKST